MSVDAQWGNAQYNHIVITFHNEWTWNALHRLEDQQLSDMLQQSPSTPLLMDMRASVWIRPHDLQHEVMRSGQLHSRFSIPIVIFTLMDVAIGTLLVQMHSRYASNTTKYVHAHNLNDAYRHIDSGMAFDR